jgi:hypothetical protein
MTMRNPHFPIRIRCLLVVALCLPPLAIRGQELPRAETVVVPRAYVSHRPVPPGQEFELAVVAEIQKGFHINANKPREENLIATSLTADVPAGLKFLRADYPPGRLMKFEFSRTPLDVYEGAVTIRLKLRVDAAAKAGLMRIPLILRYQACNDVACLPPVKLPLAVDVQVAAAGAKSIPQHPAIFPK